METRYELFYSTGGHGGPYHGLGNALMAAVNIASWDIPERAITLKPYTRIISGVDSLQVIKEKHNCFCSVCPYAGEMFLHIRKITTEGY